MMIITTLIGCIAQLLDSARCCCTFEMVAALISYFVNAKWFKYIVDTDWYWPYGDGCCKLRQKMDNKSGLLLVVGLINGFL